MWSLKRRVTAELVALKTVDVPVLVALTRYDECAATEETIEQYVVAAEQRYGGLEELSLVSVVLEKDTRFGDATVRSVSGTHTLRYVYENGQWVKMGRLGCSVGLTNV